MLERFENAESVIDYSLAGGLIGAIEVAVDEENFETRVNFIADRTTIRLSAGIHPSSTGIDGITWEKRFDEIRRQAAHSSVAVIGETGLDFFRDHSPRDMQERAFADHLQLAAETGLPIIIHNRDADERVISLVSESRCRAGVFHCFSSDWKTAKQALDLGFHISFAGNVTYKNAEMIRDVASRVPRDRLLIETDAPYLSPIPVRGRTTIRVTSVIHLKGYPFAGTKIRRCWLKRRSVMRRNCSAFKV
jgi:TatD DNase family protein